MAAHLIFKNKGKAKQYRRECDIALDYPEDLESLIWVGGGIHAPKELGRALHHSYGQKHPVRDEWTMRKATGVEVPNGETTEVPDYPEEFSGGDTLEED